MEIRISQQELRMILAALQHCANFGAVDKLDNHITRGWATTAVLQRVHWTRFSDLKTLIGRAAGLTYLNLEWEERNGS